ncbi:MAG TPA: PASTA domain-containing protein [Syntrophorhabdaceae bacterium]|nr:PASTA domain-containing protein [Syntrophorhabdaceae bacterium]HQM81499.1 PASTA domain-containing protein [Syntrophorhabdaceae bacterium]
MKWLKNLLYVFIPVAAFILSLYLTIDIVLKGQGTILCPDVRGKRIEEAKKIAEDKGLSLTILRYERRNDVPYNHVTIQKPDANIAIRKDRILYVIVSEGPQLVEIPNLTGQPFEKAAEMLGEKLINIRKIIYVPHERTGRVIAQTPKGGSAILEQGGIILVVGSEHKPYYMLPLVTNANIDALLEEMEMKKIRYKIEHGMKEQPAGRPGIRTSIPPRTVFNNDNELIININTGGQI